MTQKEFLESFINYTMKQYYASSALHPEEYIEEFLEQHHKEYFEVEHIEKEEQHPITASEVNHANR
jgi:hypothetical protein